MRVRYVLRRLFNGVIAIFLVAVLIFFISRLSGDPALLMAPAGSTQVEIEAIRHRLGLDRPLVVQLGDYLFKLSQGDLGTSFMQQGQPALKLVLDRLPATLELAVTAILLAFLVAVPVGVITAIWRGRWPARLLMGVNLISQSVPSFFLALVLMLIFSVKLKWLPPMGRESPLNLIMPALTLAAFSSARMARLLRSSTLDVLNLDYVRTARAKGVPYFGVILKHVLKNSIMPVITVLALEFGTMLGGTIVTESIFAWPGIGMLSIDAISVRDFPLVQAVALLMAVGHTALNFMADVSYTFLDPRIIYE